MQNDLHAFEQFMKQRDEASLAYMNGDSGPLGEIVARHSPTTFFGPRGGSTQGTEAVWAKYERDGKNFEKVSEGRFEILDMAASDGIAYWVGFQRATVYMRGRSEPVVFNLRVTEIFRREGGTWKLIHRHADPLIAEPEATRS